MLFSSLTRSVREALKNRGSNVPYVGCSEIVSKPSLLWTETKILTVAAWKCAVFLGAEILVTGLKTASFQ